MDLLGQAIDHDTAAENEKTAGKQSDAATVPAKIFHPLQIIFNRRVEKYLADCRKHQHQQKAGADAAWLLHARLTFAFGTCSAWAQCDNC